MPRPALHIGPKQMVESSAPALELGQYHTTSNALRSLYFMGELQPWPGFLSAVQTMHETLAWRNTCLGLKLHVRDPYTSGNVVVGDEHGVQGRFHKYFGDPLNAIFESQSIDLRFADFKCVQSTYGHIPDVILKDGNDHLKVVGELKVPWVLEHRIDDIFRNDAMLRKMLAQPIMYMQDLGCAYGFLSNYDETIFLRQLVDSQGVWRIEYSPVIPASTMYNMGNLDSRVVSARQCFFYVACDALNQGPAQNTTAGWIDKKP